MGLYSVDLIKAEILFSVIKDILLRFNLVIPNIRGLACGDMIKQITVLKDVPDTAFEIVKHIKYSPQIEACFGRTKLLV